MTYQHKDTDDELTPPEAFEPLLESMGAHRFNIDVASHPQSLVPADIKCVGPHRGGLDGLIHPWWGFAWVQPPYGNPAPWLTKAASNSDNDDNAAICLVNATTDTKVWHEVVFPRAVAILWVRGRIRFISPHNPGRTAPAKKPSAVIWFGCEPLHLAPLERLGRLSVP